MSELVTALHFALPDSKGAPDWVHLVPAGTFAGEDGRGPYALGDAQAVIDASMRVGRLPIDENHATDLALRNGGAAPARGWITEMQSRADGLWGRVDWTDAGRAMVASREYRGISPVFAHAKAGGRVTRVLRAALTNAPNLAALTTLHTQRGTGMELAKLREALGFDADADEAAVLARIKVDRDAVATHARQLASIAAAAGARGDAKPEEIVTALQTRAAQGDPTKLAQEVVALQTQLGELRQDRAREKAVATIDAAMAAGKPIPASIREHYIARHMQDAAAVETELAAMPSLHAGGLGSRPAREESGVVLSAQDQEVIATMGVDPKKFAETRSARIAKGM